MVNKRNVKKPRRFQDLNLPGPSSSGEVLLPSTAEDESMYFIVRDGKASIQSLIDDWIDNYMANRDEALLKLMQFFISAAGCKGILTLEMQTTMEHADIIKKMTEEFQENTSQYPLVQHGQAGKKFKSNISEFIHHLIKLSQNSIIYDQHLMDNLISLLTQLSDSQVRAFRHTSTFAAMKIMTALVDVVLTVSVNLESIQRQYDVEQQKSAKNRAPGRLEALMTKKDELQENTIELQNMLTYLFKAVFVHRYRDTVSDIRAICMYEIGQWMIKYPNLFLDDTYLKYIGWTIHDKDAEVRLKCLQALQPLYANEALMGRLDLFTSKFKDRIVQMTLDKDFDVAVQAVKMVTSILRYKPEMLGETDFEHVYELVYGSHKGVAQAAGDFLCVRLLSGKDFDPDIRTSRGKKRLENTPHLRDLVQFFIESDFHEHGAYLVDSLIEGQPMMKDWECMTDLLLEEPGEMEMDEQFSDKQETALIEIMVCCIKQAASGEVPIGRGQSKKVLSAKELKQVNEDKKKMTAHFIQTLPPLLHKYLPDPEKIFNLILIPQYFDLNEYTISRQEKNLDQLLSMISVIADKNMEKQVLDGCSKTLERLCEGNDAISRRCGISRSRLLDKVCNNFKEICDEYMNIILGNDDPDEDEIFSFVSSLHKVECFINAHNLNEYKIWETMFQIIVKYNESAVGNMTNEEKIPFPMEAVKAAIASCYYGIVWDKTNIDSDEDREQEHIANEAARLRSDFDKYLLAMREIMQQNVPSPYSTLQEEAFTSICDLLIYFNGSGKELAQNSPLHKLRFRPDMEICRMLMNFIQSNVFVPEEEELNDEQEQDDHTKIENMHKRRNLLAGFCKLIVCNILPMASAANIFKHYLTFYNDYGDIIKGTLGKAKENNSILASKTIVLALSIKFNEFKNIEGQNVNRYSGLFVHIKDLAHRFALGFGFGTGSLKHRDAVAQLHHEGIKLSFSPMENKDRPDGPPPNLAFLEILNEFTFKLLKQDKEVVLKYLDARLGGKMPLSQGEDWQPFWIYRNALQSGVDEITPIKAINRQVRKLNIGADDDGDEEDEEIEE